MGAGTPTNPPLSTTNANTRGSVPAQTPNSQTTSGSFSTTLAAGMPQNQPGSTRNADTKKSEKVKDFYSSLLNKKKDKNRASATIGGEKQPPTQSNGEAETILEDGQEWVN